MSTYTILFFPVYYKFCLKASLHPELEATNHKGKGGELAPFSFLKVVCPLKN